MRRLIQPAATGILAAAAGLAAAHLLATLTRPAASPLITIGGTIIDATPTPVKEFAVREFGTADKPLLLTGILAGLAVVAAMIGILTARRRGVGLVAVTFLGLLGVATALTRPTAQPHDAIPAAAAGVVAAAALALLTKRLPTPQAQPADRRDFLRAAALIGGGALVAGASAGAIGYLTNRRADRTRSQINLPPATDPAGQRINTPGFYTSNEEFYRVDTALVLPQIDVETWRLRIGGMVDRPIELSFQDLLRLPLIERDITLNCVSNEVGGPYIGTARWLGAALAPLLRQASIHKGANQIVARSIEGMTIGTPTETVLDGRDTILALAMNGQPLPLKNGFPVRMLTPGLYGYAGSCKWITEIELSTFDLFDAYWVRRGWAANAPVKTASRIDRPAPFARLEPGPLAVAGVAWAQRRGIAAVEVQIGTQPWQQAELLPAASPDTWVQWRHTWQATPGTHQLRVRATDSTGTTQTEQRQPPFPDGATGWHTITITIN